MLNADVHDNYTNHQYQEQVVCMGVHLTRLVVVVDGDDNVMSTATYVMLCGLGAGVVRYSYVCVYVCVCVHVI